MPSAAGVKTKLPPAILIALNVCPAVTATPKNVRLPAAGSVSMRTALKESPASGSLKPKSATVKV